jgi:hypothetical protein
MNGLNYNLVEFVNVCHRLPYHYIIEGSFKVFKHFETPIRRTMDLDSSQLIFLFE